MFSEPVPPLERLLWWSYRNTVMVSIDFLAWSSSQYDCGILATSASTALSSAIDAEVIARDAAIATAKSELQAEIDADIAAIPAFDDSHLMPKSGNTTVAGELTANKFIGSVDGEVGGAGSTPAPVTGTTITANTKFVGALEGNADTATLAATATYAINAGIATTADRLTSSVTLVVYHSMVLHQSTCQV